MLSFFQAFDRRAEPTLLYFHPVWRMQKEEVVSSKARIWFSQSVCGPWVMAVILFSSRNYAVPDPPGLFDGHVWPMYLKHKTIMEVSGVDVCKSRIFKLPFVRWYLCRTLADLFFCTTVQLDGTKSKEQLFNFVYGDILNDIQKSL